MENQGPYMNGTKSYQDRAVLAGQAPLPDSPLEPTALAPDSDVLGQALGQTLLPVNRMSIAYICNPEEAAQNAKKSKSGPRRPAWTAEEDETMIDLKKRPLNWTFIASHLPGRTPGACMTRWSLLKKMGRV
ncbi:Fc.00g044480.m01.CDS01 [Cosmosporella sp. VM-42]